MSVSQAQHKRGTMGEINSINFLCGPAGLYNMFTRQKTKALFPQLNIMARSLRSLGWSMRPNSLIFNKLAKGNKSSFVLPFPILDFAALVLTYYG